MKIVCGKCAAEVELPRAGESPEVRCPSCAAVFMLPSLADGEELPHPDTFPGYRVVAIVGYGGMGAVYRAVQLSMDREVAIKVLLRKYAHVPRFVARFEREALALASLNHANIVAVIDRGRVGDTYFLVMEYVHGRTLRYLVKNELLSIERSLDIAVQICRALEAAHECGVVHRDIKPSNILVQDSGVVKVADFGIVHMVEEDDAAERERRSRLGTAKYMAPEQRGTGEPIDARADLYGLGVTLFEMLTGDLPRGGPPSELNRLVPKNVDAIVERAARSKREERFQSAAEMCAALELALQTMKLEDTSATAVLPVVAPATLPCPACGEAVPFEQHSCPGCGAAVSEVCYRANCGGVDPVGAERCSRCGGHLTLLKNQRRAELEGLLQQAEAHLAAGQFALALGDVRVVQGLPYRAFADLRERAAEVHRQIRRQVRLSHARSFLKGAAAVLVIGAAAALCWTAERGLSRRRAAQAVQEGKPPVTPRPASIPVKPPSPPPQPRPARPRDAFSAWLLAVTDKGWADRAPAARLLAACDAGRLLVAGGNDGQAAKRLAKALDDIARGQPVTASPDALRARLAETLDEACGAVFKELRGQPALKQAVGRLAINYAKARKSIDDAPAVLDLASTTLYDLMTTAEALHNTQQDARSSLLLLDASLEPPPKKGDLGQATVRIVKAGVLLVRYLDRDGKAIPELVNDARERLRRAQRSPDDAVRLACGTEALVEAFAAKLAYNRLD